jgi:hypothetical protein
MNCNDNQVLLLDSVIQQPKGKSLSFKSGLWVCGNFLQFGPKTFVISDGSELCKKATIPLKVDYLMIRNHKSSHLGNAFKNYKSPFVIIDASNPKYKARKLEKLFVSDNVSVVNISNSGAVTIEM